MDNGGAGGAGTPILERPNEFDIMFIIGDCPGGGATGPGFQAPLPGFQAVPPMEPPEFAGPAVIASCKHEDRRQIAMIQSEMLRDLSISISIK